MANEPSAQPKAKPAPFLVIGLSLLTIGIILPSDNRPLQIAILLAAVGMLLYAAVVTRKNKSDETNEA
jgi:uncharacterized membrane protein